MEWHFRNRTSNRLPYLQIDIEMPVRDSWNLTLPKSIFDTPIFAEDAIFVVTTEELYKLDPDTGKLHWSIKPGTPLRSSPAYYNGRIYFSSQPRRVLYCVNSDNGKEIWRMSPGGDSGSCCIDDNNMYLKCIKGAGKNQVAGFACYSLADMSEIWFHPSETSISVNGCAIAQGYLVYGDLAGNIYGLESSTGKELWKEKTTDWFPIIEDRLGKKKIPCAIDVPIIVDGVVVISAETPGQTFGLDLKSGKVLWLFNAKDERLWNYHSMGIDDTRWYCLAVERQNPRQYFAFDIKTGKLVLKNDISMYKEKLGHMNVFSRSGMVIGDYHFVSVYNPPRVVAFNKSTGEVAWTYMIDRSNLRGDSRGIFADGKLIWVRDTGDIYCFEIQRAE